MHNIRGSLDVVLEMGHKMCTVAFDLLIGRYGTKDDLSELAAFKRAVSNASKKPIRRREVSQFDFHRDRCVGSGNVHIP